MFTTRFWGSTAVLLCALLLQNCQPNSLRAIEEGGSAKAPFQAVGRPLVSETLTQPIGYLLSPPSTTAAHQPEVTTAAPSFSILPGLSLSNAFLGTPLPASVHLTASTTPSRNILTASDRLPLAAMPGTSHAVPLRSVPTLSHVSSSVFTAASGERVRFSQVEGQWQATLQRNNGSSISQRTLPVVGPADVGSFLTWLRGQDHWTSRARIHVLHTSQPSYRSCVYVGKAGLLGGMPGDEEDSKPPAKKLRTSGGYSPTAQNEEPPNHHGDSYAENALAMSAGGNPMAESHNLSLSSSYFGAEEWKRHFGGVGSAPSLPSNIDAILDSPCPFWPGKKVRDTHLLVLIPATVDDAPFTLNLLGELIQRPNNGGHKTKYKYYDSDVKAQFGEKAPSRSYWLLMTRGVLEASRGKSYSVQKGLVSQCAEKAKQPYELPGVLGAATAVLLYHACTGERLLGDDPWTYTRCRGVVAYRDNSYPVIVGSFGPSGFNVSRSSYRSGRSSSCGVAVCRKF
jgi:hypothetical protein